MVLILRLFLDLLLFREVDAAFFHFAGGFVGLSHHSYDGCFFAQYLVLETHSFLFLAHTIFVFHFNESCHFKEILTGEPFNFDKIVFCELQIELFVRL